MEKKIRQLLMIVGSLVIVSFAGCSTSTQKAANSAEPVEQNTAKPITGETPPELKHPSPSAVAEKAGVAKTNNGPGQSIDQKPMPHDAAAADTKYARTKIALVGKITGINTSGKFPIVWLEGHTTRMSVRVSFYDELQRIRVGMLKTGDIVKLIGTSSGFDLLKDDIEFAAYEVSPSE
jgi:hypothetical protein